MCMTEEEAAEPPQEGGGGRRNPRILCILIECFVHMCNGVIGVKTFNKERGWLKNSSDILFIFFFLTPYQTVFCYS